MSETRHLSLWELKELLLRLDGNALTEDDRTTLRAIVEGYVMLEKALKRQDSYRHEAPADALRGKDREEEGPARWRPETEE